MKFELHDNILAIDGSVWVERGVYPIIKTIDDTRFLINVGSEVRELVVVASWKGTLILDVEE